MNGEAYEHQDNHHSVNGYNNNANGASGGATQVISVVEPPDR